MGRPHPAHRGVDENSPYVLRGLENGKTQLERLTSGPVLEPHPRLFYQDQTFEPFRRPGCTGNLLSCHTAGGFASHRLDHLYIVLQPKYLWRTRGGNKEQVQSINRCVNAR